MKIMIVPGGEVVGRMIGEALEEHNEDPVNIPHEQNIDEYFNNYSYDIVIVNPEGFHEPEKYIKKIATLAQINTYKLIFSETYNRIDAHNLGMDDILARPIDHNDLQNKLQQAHIKRHLKQAWSNMRVLLVDKNAAATRAVTRELQAQNEEVVLEPERSKMYDHLKSNFVDVIIIDPTPMNDTSQLMQRMGRLVPPYIYTLLFTEGFRREHAQNAGMNDILLKPVEQSDIKQKMQNARVLHQLNRHLSDTSTDYPGSDNFISKSAFKQLFFTALERSIRYLEIVSVILIGIDNYKEILDNDGIEAIDNITKRLSEKLVKSRRYADILGQTGEQEFSFLLLSHDNKDEPILAVNRFVKTLSELESVYEFGLKTTVKVYLRGISLPTGTCFAYHILNAGEDPQLIEKQTQNNNKSGLWNPDRLQ